MTIKRHDGPSDGRLVVGSALAKRFGRHAKLSPLGGAAQTGSPLPFYHLGLDDAARSSPLQFAKRTGWRFPVVGGDTPGLVIVSEQQTNSKFEGLSYGVVAQRLIQASNIADQELGSHKEQYEPRLLDVPALHFVALWLAGPNDVFIPLLDGNPPGTAPLSIVGDFEARIQAELAKRAKSAPPGATQSSPTK